MKVTGPFAAVLLLAAVLVWPTARAQQDLDDVLQRFDWFVAEGNYPRALEELEWARRALEKAHHARIANLFPPRLAGRDGGEIARQSLFGLTTHTRRYTGDGADIEVVLTEGGTGGAPMAAFEQLSRLLGAAVDAEKLRVDGRTATLVPGDGANESVLSVQLESGGVLRFSTVPARRRVLESAAREFGIGRLDDYLSGDDPVVKSTI